MSSFFDLIRDPVRFFSEISNAGPIAETKVGPRRFYVVRDPEVIRELLTTQAGKFEKFPRIDPRRSIFGNGLLTTEPPAHIAQRRTLQPAFHRDLLAGYAVHIEAATAHAISQWKPGAEIDIGRAMNHLALDIVSRCFFSLHDFQFALEIGKCVETMLSMVNHLVMPWGGLLVRLSPSYRAASRRLDRLIRKLLTESRGESDMISMLLSTGMSEQEIRDEIATIIVAGHETVANGLTWCLYLLARHEALQSSVNVEHAFSEALRLYPPIWILGRRALEPYEHNGFRVGKGSVFLVCMADLHRRPEFFDAPEAFHPDRWLNPQWPAYAYIPFGGGNRRCIGERFAWMEGTVCLEMLLRQWRFSLVDQAAPETLARLTLQPRTPLRLRVSER